MLKSIKYVLYLHKTIVHIDDFYNMIGDNLAEKLPLVDNDGNLIGSATRGECHGIITDTGKTSVDDRPVIKKKLLHPVVHLHLFNSAGELYLQKRPDWKKIQPGKWDTATGGHVDFGESVSDALVREVREELGISDFTPVFLEKYIFESPVERELIYMFKAVYDGEVCPSEELDGGRFWSEDEIRKAMGQGILTPNFESEYKRLLTYLEKSK